MEETLEQISALEFKTLMDKAQMTAALKGADIIVLMAWCVTDEGEPKIALGIVDTSDLPEDRKRLSRYITPQEAAAIAALFITAEGELEKAAYAVLESTFKNVPNNLRPIP